jgi:predicted dehydrogenase
MVPCEDENYDVYFVAGFHHTHAPIAVHGLRQGADVVVEKPLATTEDQLEQLMDAISKSKGRYFAGFHKRYNPLNALIRRDVAEVRGKPLSYHAIVHEIPLPARHWYHWPNSRGTIVSNACHWIDHFLFLNEFSQPTRIESHRLANADIVLLIDLNNGASASIVITHNGSTRLGVREIVWVTAGDRTATIIDDRLYSSESSSRFIRQTRLHRYASSQRMYDEIGQQLIKGGGGDSAVSVQVSTQAMLLAQNQLVLSGHARNLAEQDGV